MTAQQQRYKPIWDWARHDPTRVVLRSAAHGLVLAGPLVDRVTRLVNGLARADPSRRGPIVLVGTDLPTSLSVYFAAMWGGFVLVPTPTISQAQWEQLAAGAPNWIGTAILSATVAAQSPLPASRQWRTFIADEDPVQTIAPHESRLGAAEAPPADCGHAGRLMSLGDSVTVEPTTPESPESQAAVQALQTELLGFSADRRVMVRLPHLSPGHLELLGGLVHAGRELLEPGVSWSRETADRSPVPNLLTTRKVMETIVSHSHRSQFRHLERIVVVGSAVDEKLRAGVRELAGTDRLVEYGSTDGNTLSLRAPAGEPLTGLWSWGRQRPNAPAVVDETGNVTTAQRLLERAELVASSLAETDPASTIATVLSDSIDMLAVYLGVIRAGRQFVPIALDIDRRLLLDRLKSAQPALLVVPSGSESEFRPVADVVRESVCGGPQVVTVDELLVPGVTEHNLHGPAGRLVPFTSGTTGVPRLVRHRPANVSPELLAAVQIAIASRLGLGDRGTHMVTCPLHLPAALGMATLALHSGQSLLVMDKWAPAAALRMMQDRAVTTTFMVPSMFASLLELRTSTPEHGRAPELTSVVHGAARCPIAVKMAMLEWWGPILVECYGANEALATFATAEEWSLRPGTVGKPFPGVDIRILDSGGKVCPPGRSGDVFVGDNGFAYGDGSAPYRRVDGLVSFGDVGYLDGDGWLFLTGRATEVINVGGTKFHPTEVEDILLDVPGVQDCAVVGLPHKHLGEVTAAFVVAQSRDQTERLGEFRSTLVASARARLPLQKVPVRIAFVPSLPRDGLGKLRRATLRDSIDVGLTDTPT